MRVTLVIAILLLVSCFSADAWWRRRRRSRRTFDVRANAGNGRDPSITGTWTHQGENGQGSVSGTVDQNGNWGVEAGYTWNFRKRRSADQGFNVTLKADPCNFETYDDDRNGEITVEEFIMIFGEDDEDAMNLFDALDLPNDDDIITFEEFIVRAPSTIIACADMVVEE